jgi:hypothetical protein
MTAAQLPAVQPEHHHQCDLSDLDYHEWVCHEQGHEDGSALICQMHADPEYAALLRRIDASPLAAPETREPGRDAPETSQAPVTNIATEQLHDALHTIALNADATFRIIGEALIPGFKPTVWDEYAEAIQDHWDLNHGADPYLYSDANPKLFGSADVRAFEIDQREERRDSALAALLDAIREAP